MINPQLLNYVKSSLLQSHSPQAIRETLLAHGWDPKDVEQALLAGGAHEPVKTNYKKTLATVLVLVFLLLVGGGIAGYFLIPPSPEKILKTAGANTGKVKSFDFSGKIVADVSTPSGLFSMNTLINGVNNENTDPRIAGSSNTKFGIDFEGTADASDENHPKAELNMSFNLSVFSLDFDLKMLDKIFFFKIGKIPNFGGAEEFNKFTGNWIKVDSNELKNKYSIDISESSPVDLTDGQKKQIEELWNISQIFREITKLPDDSIEGVGMYHLALDIDDAALFNYLKEVDKIENAGGSLKTNSYDAFKDLSFSNWEVWIGKKDKMIHRVSGDLTLKPSNDITIPASGTVHVLLNMKNFNEPVNISEPTEYKNLEDLIKEYTEAFKVQTPLRPGSF